MFFFISLRIGPGFAQITNFITRNLKLETCFKWKNPNNQPSTGGIEMGSPQRPASCVSSCATGAFTCDVWNRIVTCRLWPAPRGRPKKRPTAPTRPLALQTNFESKNKLKRQKQLTSGQDFIIPKVNQLAVELLASIFFFSLAVSQMSPSLGWKCWRLH